MPASAPVLSPPFSALSIRGLPVDGEGGSVVDKTQISLDVADVKRLVGVKPEKDMIFAGPPDMADGSVL
jgi:hypothetical protein